MTLSLLPPTRAQQRKQCHGKQRYRTFGQASEKVRVHRWCQLPSHEFVHAYYCECCEGYHVGRRNSRRAMY